MNFDPSQPIEELEPVTFELASGARIRVSLGYFWSKLSKSERARGTKSYQYLAIRIYGDEDSYPNRLQQLHELHHGMHFERQHCSKIWQWLISHIASRERFEHEDTDEFLSLFESAVGRIQAEDEDMLEHLERLPSFTIPDEFDKFDDSIFRDKNDPESI